MLLIIQQVVPWTVNMLADYDKLYNSGRDKPPTAIILTTLLDLRRSLYLSRRFRTNRQTNRMQPDLALLRQQLNPYFVSLCLK